jgi:hypothetical protein
MTERKVLFMDPTYGYHAEQDTVSDTFNLYGLTVGGGNLAMGSNRITGLPDTPTAGTDAVNQNYVDARLTGLGWIDPVNVPNLLGNVDCMSLVGNAAASVIEALSVEGDAYVVTAADGVGALSTATVGDVWQYVSSTWVKLATGSGGFVPAGFYALLSTTTALISPYTDGTDDGKRADFAGSSNTGSLVAPAAGESYVIDGSGAKYEGDLREWSGTAWVQVEAASGGYVPAGVRAIVGLTPAATLISPYTEATDDCKIVEFSGSSNTGADTSEAVNSTAVLVQDTLSAGYYDNVGFTFQGTVPTGSWVQFTGAGSIVAGAGLLKTGQTLSVNFGDGITEASDYVAVDLTSGNSGLELTGTTPDKTLQAKVDGAHGIVLGATGLELELDETPDTLDVDADGLKVVGLPSLFKINGTAVGATVTAGNLDDLTDGSNADLLHTHASATATEAPKVEDTHLNNVVVAAGDVVCWSATADELAIADNTTSVETARVIGIARTGGAANPGTSEVVKHGVCTGCLSGATVRTPYFLGATGARVVFGSIPTPGRVIRLGFAKNATDLDVQIMDLGYKR